MRKFVFVIAIMAVLGTFAGVQETRAEDVQCFQEFARDMDECSYRQTWYERSFCGADAELELVACVGAAISPWK